jgi:hypothetical protein
MKCDRKKCKKIGDLAGYLARAEQERIMPLLHPQSLKRSGNIPDCILTCLISGKRGITVNYPRFIYF